MQDVAVGAEASALVERIHATPHRAVYAFAGAGAQALAWLHSVGGSSRTVLEAHDHYHPTSLAEALGEVPARSASPDVAAGLARRSEARAGRLLASETHPGPRFGLGLAATIATDRAKRGTHRVHVASADALGVASDDVVLDKGARDRTGEEALASMMLLHAAADACGVMGLPPLPFGRGEVRRRSFRPSPEFAHFLQRQDRVLALGVDGRPTSEPSGPSAGAPNQGLDGAPRRPGGAIGAIVSGSFHPLHGGHLRLADAAAAHLGRVVGFEIPLRNAEKSTVDAAEVRRRAAQFFGIRPLLLTHLPLFADKAERLGDTVFVVGVDTARRVLEPRFYGGESGLRSALDRIQAAGGRFLVAGRASEEGFRTIDELAVPAGYEDLFEGLPGFRYDLSSTSLRSTWPDATADARS